MTIDWDAAATLATGAAALFAAFWTIRDTRRSAKVDELVIKLGIAKRTKAVMEVTIGSIEAVLKEPSKYSSTIPWTAFAALAGDIGALEQNDIRLFFFIESIARDAEAAAGKLPEKLPPPEDLKFVLAKCEALNGMCTKTIGHLEADLAHFYAQPTFKRALGPSRATSRR